MNDTLYLSIVITLLSLLGSSSADPLEDEKVKVNYLSAFAETEQKTLEPTETKRLLWTIDSALMSKTDEKSVAMRRQVRGLLDATVINQNMCMRGVFIQIDRLARDNIKYPNILDYLNQQKKELFETCQSTFVRLLRQDVRQLNKKETKQLGLLHASIIKANKGVEIGKPDFTIPKPVMMEGVVLFLATKLGKPSDKLKNRDVFRVEFEKHVGALCGYVKRNLSSSIQIYEALMTDRNVVSRLDTFESGWLADVKICNTILANINSVCWTVHDLWLKKT